MPTYKWVQRLRKTSGRSRDLFVIILGIILGASTQFFFAHLYYITRDLLGMFGNWICRHPDLVKTGGDALWAYVWASFVGMVIELIAIIVVIVILVLLFHRDDDEEVVKAIDKLGDKLGSKLDRIEKKIGNTKRTRR